MSLAVCLHCRESSYFHTTMLCVFSNIIGGFILLHFNCDSEVPAEGTGYTSTWIITPIDLCEMNHDNKKLHLHVFNLCNIICSIFHAFEE